MIHTSQLTALFIGLVLTVALIGCEQSPSEINSSNSDHVEYHSEKPQSPEQIQAIGQALGVEQAVPAEDDKGQVWLSVQTQALSYADAGLVVALEGLVQLHEQSSAEIQHTRWRQIAGPEAVILNPDQPQTQVLLPQVSSATDLIFALAAADTEGRVAEVHTRVRVPPPEQPIAANIPVHANGPGPVTVTLSLPESPQTPVVVHYTTQDGTALAGRDYQSTQGQVTLDAANPQAQVTVDVLNSAVTDGDIYFRVLYTTDSASMANQSIYVVVAEQGSEPVEPGEPGEPTEPEPTEPEEPPSAYNITYAASSGGSLDGQAQQTVKVGETGTEITAIAEPGYVFVGWSDGLKDASRADTLDQDTLSLYAQFRVAELWMVSGHSGNLSVNSGPITATVTWPEEAGVEYNLIITDDPLTELDYYSVYGAELLQNVKPPVQLEQLTTDQPVYLALEADGQLHGWTSFVPRVWGTNGDVLAQVVDADGNRYVGGDFSFVAPETGGGAAALPAAGSSAFHPLAGARIEGTVYSAIPDGQGGWYLGGEFAKIDDQTRDNLAHINAAGQLTEWNPGAGSNVRTLAVDQGVIYAGGEFTEAGGEARAHLAAFDAQGQLLPWNPSINGKVLTLAIDQGVIYVGGYFTQVGGEPRSYLAAFDSQGELLPWNPGANDGVHSLTIDQSTIYAGGIFGKAGGGKRSYLAAFDTEGQLLPWSPEGVSGVVFTMAVDQGVIYVGASFLGRKPSTHLAAFDAQGEILPWNPEVVGGSVRTLAIDRGMIYVGGDFTQAGGEARARLAAFDPRGQLLPWNPGANGPVYTMAIDQGVIYAGGGFTKAGGEARSRLAAFDTQGQLLSWNPGALSDVVTLAVDQGVIYAGGYFSQAGGEERSHLAAFDPEGQLLPWNPGANFSVYSLAVDQGVIYAGGYFSQAGGEERSRLAAFDTQGQLLPWNPGVNGFVRTLAVDRGVIYAGGGFGQAAGEARSRLAAFDTQGQLLPWDPGVSMSSSNYPVVHAVAVDQGVIYAGGEFLQAGEEARSHLAAFDIQGQVLPWNPGVNGFVRTLAVDRGVIYAGGEFLQAGEEVRSHLAAFDAQGQVLSWNPRAHGFDYFASEFVKTLVTDRGVIYVGGEFTQIAGEVRSYLSVIDQDGNLLAR